MTLKGRKPVPTQLKIIRGTDQPCRVKKSEPKPKANNLRRPFKLSKVASLQWRKVSRQLREAKLLTDIDTHALAMYCEAHAMWKGALENIQEHGAVVLSQNGSMVQSPYCHIANKSYDQAKSMLVEFGMTPSSRTRVSAVDDAGDDDDW